MSTQDVPRHNRVVRNLPRTNRLNFGVVMTPFDAIHQRLPPGFNKREGITMRDFVWML